MQGGFDFAVAGVPVRVLPAFFLMAVLLGWGLGSVALVLAWVVLVFVSVLLHELAHAAVYRRSGSQATIVLHGFGGLTFGTSLPVRRDLLVSLAGPLANLAVGLPLLALVASGTVKGAAPEAVVSMAIWINVGWAVLNLLPILPLDGGHALVALLSIVGRRDATRGVQILSVGLAAAGGLVALRYGELFLAVFGAVFVVVNLRALGRGQPWTVNRPARADAGPVRGSAHAAAPSTPPAPGPAASPAGGSSGPTPAPRTAAPPFAPPARTAPPAEATKPGPTEAEPTHQPRQQPIPGVRTLDDDVGSAIRAVLAHEPELALIAVDRVRGHGLTPEQEPRADELEAWAWIQRHDLTRARPIIERIPRGDAGRGLLEMAADVLAGEVAREHVDVGSLAPGLSRDFLAASLPAT